MQRESPSSNFTLGSTLPHFSLPNVDNTVINSEDYFKEANAALVIFTCNHCPYVKGSEEALNFAVRQFLPQGLKVLAISSNDALQYPEDSFEKMKVKSSELQLPYPYLFDESQSVAKLFDAACTPECFLFNKENKLVFHGTINDSPRYPEKASKSFLAKALEEVLDGKTPHPAFVHPIGCSIKWKLT